MLAGFNDGLADEGPAAGPASPGRASSTGARRARLGPRAGRPGDTAAPRPRSTQEEDTDDRHADPGPHRQLGRRAQPGRCSPTSGRGGYGALQEGAGDGARRDHRAGQGLRPARPRRRRLPDRHEVGLHPAGQPEPEVPRRQRRRVGAGHLQGHPADDGQPAHAGRGRDHLLLRHPRQHRVHLRARRGAPRHPPPPARGRRRPTSPATSARTSTAPATTSTSSSTPAPAPTSAARRPRCSTRSRAVAANRGCARRSPPWPASTPARR